MYNGLLTRGLEVEQLGGDIPCVQVSAHSGSGLSMLVETINAVAEVRDLRAEQAGVPSEGRIIESRKESGKGNVATVIVTRGTLRIGAIVVAGTSFARVRQLASGDGRNLEVAGPGAPVEVSGWKDLPEAGDQVLEAPNEEDAKRAIDTRKRLRRNRKTLADVDMINEKRRIEAENAAASKEAEANTDTAGRKSIASAEFAKAMQTSSEPNVKELRLIIKADFSGTVEAVSGSLAEIGNTEAKVKVISTGVGDVTEGDLAMAKAVDGEYNVLEHRTVHELIISSLQASLSALTSRPLDRCYPLRRE